MQGVDCSADMIDYAEKHHASDTIKFRVLDISERSPGPRLLFPDGFHKIFSLYCLHWIRDLSSCVRNIHDLLVEGGESLLIFLANNPIFTMYRIMAQKIKWASYMKVNFVISYQTMKRDIAFKSAYVALCNFLQCARKKNSTKNDHFKIY